MNIKEKILNNFENCDIGFVIKNIKSGEVISHNDNIKMHAASVIKVPILYEALLQIQNNELDFNDKYKIPSEEKVGGCGVLQILHDNVELTIEDLLNLMIDVSDNTATNVLMDILDKEKINSSIQKLGLENTLVARKLMKVVPGLYSYTTAYDTGILLEEFLLCNNLKEDIADKGIKIMLNQQYNDRLSTDLSLCPDCKSLLEDYLCSKCGKRYIEGIPVRFAHKTGEISTAIHDAGILEIGDSKVIVAFLTSNVSNKKSVIEAFRTTGIDIYKYFS